MKRIKFLSALTLTLTILCISSATYADISDAALLYLRIAPGARAAGMGEAYVAVADDATSTHWNPAGLGAAPLADDWQYSKVDPILQPLSDMTVLKTRGGSDYLAYDVWAVSAKGLVRFDNKNWYRYEVFRTKSNQTIKDIVKSYFIIDDDDLLNKISEKVAEDNSSRTYQWVKDFVDTVMNATPDSYSDRAGLQSEFDSLLTLYNQGFIDWMRLEQAVKYYRDGIKDGALSEKEVDRINFAVEKSKSRFLPEELKIYYSTLFDSKITSLASSGDKLVVGTENGLYIYNNESWRKLTVENGLPSNNILTVYGQSGNVYIGTDKGVAMSNGITVTDVGNRKQLPEAPVTAIAATSKVDVWAVVDNKLYYFDGKNWNMGRTYTTTIDDTPEKIAEKFALYGTDTEKAAFIEMMKTLNSGETVFEEEAAVDDTSSAPKSLVDMLTGNGEDSTKTESTPAPVKKNIVITSADQKFEPGVKIKIPYIAGFVGNVKVLYIGFNRNLWVGTDYGVAHFNGQGWSLPGYKTVSVTADMSLDSVITKAAPLVNVDKDKVTTLNDISEGTIAAGTSVKIPYNPASSPVNSISERNQAIYFATDEGMLKIEHGTWSRVKVGDVGKNRAINVNTGYSKLWFASSNQIITKADGRTDISMMFAKWLPQLADDMYYFFISAATNKDGWGTFGGNITYISYGTLNRTDAEGNPIGTFDPYDVTLTLSYGNSLWSKMKVGGSVKIIYSHLTTIGTALEVGEGTATAFAFDAGLLYQLNNRSNLGLAITNLGPEISYIDAEQSDPLPTNLAVGISYKLLNTDYYHLLSTFEINKSMVGLNDSFKTELKQVVFNGGFEFSYADMFAARFGYIHDEEGKIKTVTLGFGLKPLRTFKVDFAYIPSSTDTPLSNTLRISWQVMP